MKLKLTRARALIVGVALTGSLAAATQTSHTTRAATAPVNLMMQDQSIYASVERVTVADLQKLLADGKAVVIDVRLPEQYATGHIKGARSIPLTDMEARAAELPRDKQIVTYCA